MPSEDLFQDHPLQTMRDGSARIIPRGAFVLERDPTIAHLCRVAVDFDVIGVCESVVTWAGKRGDWKRAEGSLAYVEVTVDGRTLPAAVAHRLAPVLSLIGATPVYTDGDLFHFG